MLMYLWKGALAIMSLEKGTRAVGLKAKKLRS